MAHSEGFIIWVYAVCIVYCNARVTRADLETAPLSQRNIAYNHSDKLSQ